MQSAGAARRAARLLLCAPSRAHCPPRLRLPCRKTLRLYLSCLADAAAAPEEGPEPEAGRPPPLEVLQAAATHLACLSPAASKAWEGCAKLARGHFLLALLAGLHTCSPLEEMAALLEAPPPSAAPPSAAAEGRAAMQQEGSAGDHHPEPAAHQTPGTALRTGGAGAAPGTAAPASAQHATPADARAGASAAQGLLRALPTPATQARRQMSAHLLQTAARLQGSQVEGLLAKAHQVRMEASLFREGCMCQGQHGSRHMLLPRLPWAEPPAHLRLPCATGLQRVCCDC